MRSACYPFLLAIATLAAGCSSSKSPESGAAGQPLPEHGLVLALPAHFGKPTSSSGSYEWTANEGLTTLRIATAGAPGAEARAMPGQTVDYSRATSLGGLPATERRTQEKIGVKRRIVWTGIMQGPKGRVEVKLTMIQAESPEEFGETFWKNLRGWIRTL
jgi:hypothetical protein